MIRCNTFASAPAERLLEGIAQLLRETIQPGPEFRDGTASPLELMRAHAEDLWESIPADHVEVSASKVATLDMRPLWFYRAEGVSLPESEVTHHASVWLNVGTAGQRAGEIRICSISRVRLEELKWRSHGKEPSAQAITALRRLHERSELRPEVQLVA